MDSLCLKISQLEPNEITKCHDELQKCYNESNTNNKMLILISYLVNKHPEIQNFIPSDGKLDECNLAGCNIEEIKYVVSQLFDMKSNLQMNQLFIFMMLHRMHWVTVFGKLLCTLSLHKEENLLNLISHHPCVTYVWPAVLSMLWKQHSTHSGIFQLSYKTIQRCAHLDTPLLSQVEVALNRVKRFSAWTQSIAIFLKIPPDNDFVLRMFGEHSLLYVVHQHVNFHLDNVGEIENFLLENSESNAWQVPLFHAYIILYNTALLMRDSNQFTVDEFSKKLEDILKPAALSLPFKNRLEISNCILSMFFLTRSDLKESSHEKYHISENCDNMLLDDVDKLHVLTCTLQNYVTCDTIPSELEEETKQLQNNLEEIHWKMSTIQHLTRKSLPSLNLGQQLYGQTKSDIDLSKVESCPLRLLLSSPQDFAMYSIVQGHLDLGVQVVERYNLSDANEGRQILTMKHYYNMIETIRTAPSHNTHEVVLQEVEKFLSLDCFKDGIDNERTSTMRLTTLTDILSSVPMQYSQSKKLLSAVSNEVKHNDVHLKNFSSLLSHLKRAQSELSKCIRDDLTPPSTTLVDFLASGSSQRDLMFWRSLESLMKEFSGTEQKRLEETFVNLVNVIKQSPYHELEGDETEESKPFSSAIQKMFLYLSSIDSIMSDRKGNLLSCMDEDLSLRIGEAIFVRNEAISSLDLPFVNIPYHLVNYGTGSISLKYSHLGLKELIVLNRDGELKTPVPYTLPASDTVASLLSTLLSQLEPHPSIHLDLATQIAHSRCLERAFMETQKLARVDIRKYTEGEDATAFLINLYNLMWVHALLALETTGEFSGLISKSITCRCLTKRLVSYHLGQAGPVTLHHIEALLLDNYAHVYSTLLDQTTGLCDTEPLENPLVDWNVTRDPRTVFALANAYALSPCIEVLIPADNLDLTLERRMSQYAARHIFLLNNTLNVPILIFSYLDHVTSNQRPECELSSSDTSSNQSRETRAALIEFIKEYTSVRSFILARKDVHVLDEIRFNIRLNYADPVSPVSLPKSDFRIESHVVDYVAESDLLLGGILAALAKANPVPNTPSKLSKNKKGLQSPTPDSSQHKAYSHLAENLEILYSNSRRAQLLSKLDPEKHPLVCLLNWNADPEAVWAALEQEMNRGNYVLVLEILYYVLTPRVFMEDVRLRTMYDTVLQELAATCDTYILDVTSLNTIADFVLNNPDATSLKCLQYLSARSHEIEREKAERIEKQFFLTKLNHEITETCGLTDRSINDDSNSYDILRKIIESKDVDLAQRWCVYRNLLHEDNPDLEVLELYFIFLLDTGHTSLAENLCSALSSSHLRELCTRLISSDCDVTHVRVVVNQAMSRCKEHKSEEYEVYVRTVIGVDMLCLMIEDDQRFYRHLNSSPMTSKKGVSKRRVHVVEIGENKDLRDMLETLSSPY